LDPVASNFSLVASKSFPAADPSAKAKGAKEAKSFPVGISREYYRPSFPVVRVASAVADPSAKGRGRSEAGGTHSGAKLRQKPLATAAVAAYDV
jgi:hypothetical protein